MAHHDAFAGIRIVPDRSRGLLGGIVAGLRRRRDAQVARRRPMGLDDHLLRDIGIGRGEIDGLVQRGR